MIEYAVTGSSLEGFKTLQPSTADACFYISQDPFYPYSRPDAKEPPAESKAHEYCGRHHLELGGNSIENFDFGAMLGPFLSNFL